MSMKDLVLTKEESKNSLPRTLLVMSPESITCPEDTIPPLGQLMYEREGLLSKDIIFLTVIIQKIPRVHAERYVSQVKEGKHNRGTAKLWIYRRS
jgi:hypothetical protein